MSEKTTIKIGFGKLRLLAILLCVVAIAIIIGSEIARQQPPPRIREYTGVLEHVTYSQSCVLGSVDATIMHFPDRDFEVEGYHIYQLGRRYTIVYQLEIWGDSDRVWKILSVKMLKEAEKI